MAVHDNAAPDLDEVAHAVPMIDMIDSGHYHVVLRSYQKGSEHNFGYTLP